MNITLSRVELLAASKRAAAVAPAQSPLDTLRGVLLEANPESGRLTLSATNLEVAIEQKLPCAPQDEDSLVVNAELFEQMMEKLTGETVELKRTVGAPRLTVLSGCTRFDVPLWERGGFPNVEIPFPEDTVRITGLPALSRRTVFAMGSDKNAPMLKCVNLMFTQDGLKAACSDGSCIVTARGDTASTGNISMLVPAPSLSKLAGMSDEDTEYRVGTTGKSIVFLRENFAFSARIMDGEYIDTGRLFSAITNQFTVLTDVPDLRKTLNSVIMVESNGKVMLRFQDDMLAMRCGGTYGSAVNQLEVIPLTGIPQGEYWFLTRQLSACLRALEGTVTMGIAQGGMLTLATETAYYVQPGTRAPGNEQEKPKRTKKAA